MWVGCCTFVFDLRGCSMAHGLFSKTILYMSYNVRMLLHFYLRVGPIFDKLF